jgi:hypothetical protein
MELGGFACKVKGLRIRVKGLDFRILGLSFRYEYFILYSSGVMIWRSRD